MRHPSDLSRTQAGEHPFTLGPEGPYPSSPIPPGPGQAQVRLEAADGRALRAPGKSTYAFLARIKTLGTGVMNLRIGDRVLGESPDPLGSHLTLAATTLRQAPEGQTGLEALGRAMVGDGRRLIIQGLARVIRGGLKPIEPVIVSFRDAWALPLRRRPMDQLLDGEGRYVLSGVEGALGATILNWAINRGARHILCLGSGELTPQIKETLQALKSQGSRCRYLALDPGTNPGAQLLRDILKDEPTPLIGVLHQKSEGPREDKRLKALGSLEPQETLCVWSPDDLEALPDDTARFEALDTLYRRLSPTRDAAPGSLSKP